jgi:pimeloyl-ACP methyl ester carboxylesterase
MMTPALQIQGIDIHQDGQGTHVIVMVHGWPDSYRLWDGTVAALQNRYRCVRFSLPGFDLAQPPRPTSLTEMMTFFDAVVATVSPDAPVTLMVHDWGCIFGYEFAARYPQRVARMVAIDIGDYNSPALARSFSTGVKLQVLGYQVWLALAWKVGRGPSSRLGRGMTRWMARAMRCPAKPESIGWQMNYPYAMRWFGLAGGLGGTSRVDPACPLLYFYGQRKPFMFQSARWLEKIAAREGCAVRPLPAGHWVMLDQPSAFHTEVNAWLGSATR